MIFSFAVILFCIFITGDVIGMFVRRISAQANQVKILLQTVFGVIPQLSSQRADLVRDQFGLHKMIVVATSAGKVSYSTLKYLRFCEERLFNFFLLFYYSCTVLKRGKAK